MKKIPLIVQIEDSLLMLSTPLVLLGLLILFFIERIGKLLFVRKDVINNL